LSELDRPRIVAGAEFDERLRQDGALEVQMQLGFGQAADEGLYIRHL